MLLCGLFQFHLCHAIWHRHSKLKTIENVPTELPVDYSDDYSYDYYEDENGTKSTENGATVEDEITPEDLPF